MDKSILDMIMGQLDGDKLGKLATQAGINEVQTQEGLRAIIPVLLSAMAHNADESQGAQSMNAALERDHDGSILDRLDEYLGNPAAGEGDAILGHVLGDRRSKVEQRLASRTSLDQGALGKLLALAAPLVMGALGHKQKQEGGLNPDMLGDWLGQQREASESAGGIFGFAEDLLDTDRDGDIMDDLGGVAGNLFGR